MVTKYKPPNGWQEVELGKICEIFNGKTPSETEKREHGSPILKIKDVDANGQFRGNFGSFVDSEFYKRYDDKIIKTGDTLILNAAHNSEYVGSKSFFANNLPKNTIATGEWLIVRVIPEFMDNKFKHFFMTSSIAKDQIKDKIKGIHLYPKDVKLIKILLPPLPTQKALVSILEKAEALKQKRAEADKLTEEYLQSVFAEIFLNKGFEEVNLGNIAEFIRGPFGGSLKKEIFKKEGYLVYEQYHPINNDFSFGRYFIDKEKFNEMKRFEVKSGDILISCSGTMGKIAIVPENHKKGIINQALLKLTLDKNKIRNDFLKPLLETNDMQNKYFSNQAGAVIQNVVSVKILKQIKIPLPPLPLQQKFASIVEHVEKLKEKQKKSKEEIDNLFNSLMQKAFKGELVK